MAEKIIKKHSCDTRKDVSEISVRIAICDRKSRTCFLRDKLHLGKVYFNPPWEMFQPLRNICSQLSVFACSPEVQRFGRRTT
jgi:hypothetical protein